MFVEIWFTGMSNGCPYRAVFLETIWKPIGQYQSGDRQDVDRLQVSHEQVRVTMQTGSQSEWCTERNQSSVGERLDVGSFVQEMVRSYRFGIPVSHGAVLVTERSLGGPIIVRTTDGPGPDHSRSFRLHIIVKPARPAAACAACWRHRKRSGAARSRGRGRPRKDVPVEQT